MFLYKTKLEIVCFDLPNIKKNNNRESQNNFIRKQHKQTNFLHSFSFYFYFVVLILIFIGFYLKFRVDKKKEKLKSFD